MIENSDDFIKNNWRQIFFHLSCKARISIEVLKYVCASLYHGLGIKGYCNKLQEAFKLGHYIISIMWHDYVKLLQPYLNIWTTNALVTNREIDFCDSLSKKYNGHIS